MLIGRWLVLQLKPYKRIWIPLLEWDKKRLDSIGCVAVAAKRAIVNSLQKGPCFHGKELCTFGLNCCCEDLSFFRSSGRNHEVFDARRPEICYGFECLSRARHVASGLRP